MNSITYWILLVLAFLCCTPMLLAMKAYWFAEGLREKKKSVPAPLRSAGPSASEAERPFPGPVINQPALADREEGRKVHGKDFEEERWIWAASMEAELLVMEVEEGL